VVIGLKSVKYAVLVGLRRSPSDLAFHQEKLFTVDDHCCIGVSGLISDGRRLCKYMRSETLNYSYVYNKPLPLSRLVIDVADKQQSQTQSSSGRPFGVGLLIAGYDSGRSYLYETDPAGNYFEYFAHSIGARNQAAKTYLERNFETFPDLGWRELLQHGVQALKETVRTRDLTLTVDNTSVMIVGIDEKVQALDDDTLQPFIDRVEDDDDGDDDNNDDDNDDDNDNNANSNSNTAGENENENENANANQIASASSAMEVDV
jgi:20S proteasome subunit alpha 6